MGLGFGTALLLLGSKSRIFYFLPGMEHTHRYKRRWQRRGEPFSWPWSSSATRGRLTPAANMCREPTREETELGWAEYGLSIPQCQGIPSWHCLEFGGQKSTKLPFSAKDPAHQIMICVQLFKGVSVKGQDHSYFKF